MREIKFRAWYHPDGYMLTGDELQTGLAGTLNEYFRDPAYNFMQYTGLRDKNGVEIYEGDLMRVPARSEYEQTTFNCFEVFYHDNEAIGGQNVGFCINRMHTQGHSAGGQGYKFTPESIERNGLIVIGNIYENPELLEGGQ